MILANWLAAGFVLAASLVYGPLVSNPFAPRWVAIYLAAAVGLATASWLVVRKGTVRLALPDVLALLFVLWCAVSLEWSGDPKQGLLQLINLMALAVVYFAASRMRVAGALIGVALALLLAVALWFSLHHTLYGGFGNRNFFTEFLLIGIPLAVACKWRWLGIAAALVALAHILFIDTGHARFVALLAVALSGAVFLLAHRWYLAAALVTLGPLDAMMLLGIEPSRLLYSLGTRTELWTNTALMWADRFWLGHGFGSFNYEYPRFQEAHLGIFPDAGTFMNPVSMYAGAGHNEYLQLGAETGLIGLLIAAAFVVVLVRGHLRNRSVHGWCGLFALVAAGSLSLVGFPLQNPSTGLLVAIACGLVASGAPRGAIATDWRRDFYIPVFGAGLASVMLVTSVYYYRAQIEFSLAREAIQNGQGARAFVHNFRATNLFPLDWLARHQLSLTLAYLVLSDKASTVDPLAADKLFQISIDSSPWSPATHVGRINYLMASGRLEEKIEEAERSLAMLKTTASRQGSVWATEALIADRLGDGERLVHAITAGLSVANTQDPARQDIERMGLAIAPREGT